MLSYNYCTVTAATDVGVHGSVTNVTCGDIGDMASAVNFVTTMSRAEYKRYAGADAVYASQSAQFYE
jgi:hypothetical protein